MIRKKKILFFTLIDIWHDEKAFLNSSDKFVALHTDEVLDENSFDFVLTQKTFLLDISQDEDYLLSHMDSKSCKYSINRAKRDGVKVFKIDSEEEKYKYLSFQNEFCKEKGIPKVSYEDICCLDVYVAESAEGEYLGGCAFLISEDRKVARYKYGATAHKLNANEAILWNAICEYHKQGVLLLDLGGCVPTENSQSYYYRHYHFKKKWGGTLNDTYTYFKLKGVYGLLCRILNGIVILFFKGDYNSLVVWMNRRKMIS